MDDNSPTHPHFEDDKHETASSSKTPKTKKESPYVFQKEKINYELKIKDLPWTEKQKEIIDLFLDKKTKALFLKGPAGSSKTILSMYCGLKLLNTKKVSDLVLIRSAVESSDSKLGFLPGDIMEKFGVYITPFNDKFEELIGTPQTKKLEKDNRITVCPINFARGLHFSVKFICCDEAQNLSLREMQTLLSRVGEFCKVIICGDPDQSDLPPNKSGFSTVYDLFNTEESKEHGIHCIELTEDCIVRSDFCKFISKSFKNLKDKLPHH